MDFFVKNYIMKNKLLLFLSLNFILVMNSFGQSFYGSSDVISYSSGKVFSNSNNSVKIQIGYDGITVNGNLAYFNLEINILSTSLALIKGYSLSNPDGTISFRLNSSTGCIVQGGDSYCQTKGSALNTSNLTESFKRQSPLSFSDKKFNHSFIFQKDGTGTATYFGRAQWPLTWKVLNSNEVEIEISTKYSKDKFILSMGSTGGSLFFTKTDNDPSGSQITNTYFQQ
jgi:hypothetical protein